MTDKEKAWQAYCESIMPTRRDYVYPLQGAFYKAFCAGYDAAQQKEWVGLTHEERDAVCADFVGPDGRVGAYRSLALEVEVLLTEKNKGEVAVSKPELEIRPPNDVGSTMCIVRWETETPHGWIGAWDRKALEYVINEIRREE